MRLQDIVHSEWIERPEVFVRPDRSMKELSGCVWPHDQLRAFLERLDTTQRRAQPDLEVIVASVKEIESEWRLFVVDGRACAGSRYATYGDLDFSSDVPQELVRFAQDMTARWSPCRAFVMDIAISGNEPRVLELNGINSAGFYRADVVRVVAALARAASS